MGREGEGDTHQKRSGVRAGDIAGLTDAAQLWEEENKERQTDIEEGTHTTQETNVRDS